MIEKTVYEAADGQQFDDKEECRVYEVAFQFRSLIGLTRDKIEDVLHGADDERANAIIAFAAEIGRARADAEALKIAAQ